MNSDIEFEITSKLGKTISTSQAYWKIITEIKHPIIKGKQKLVMQTLINPDIIKRSSKDRDIYLHYRKISDRFICVVTKHENGTGFVVTAYFTNKIKQGDIIWTR